MESCNNTPVGEPCCGRSNNMGWRYLLFTLGAITLFVFFARFVLFRFQESPKFLLYRGHDGKAIEVLQKIAAFNKRECSLTLDRFEELASDDISQESKGTGSTLPDDSGTKTKGKMKVKLLVELQRYKMLFATPTMVRLTILTWITYAFDYWGFTIAGIARASIDLTRSKELNDRLTSFSYRLFSPYGSCSKECLNRDLDSYYVPELHHHLCVWHSRRAPRGGLMACAFTGTKVHHGFLLGIDGHLALPFRSSQQSGIKHRIQRHGIFLPVALQRSALRLDAGSVSSPS